MRAWRGWKSGLGPAGRGLFPPVQVAEIKALACELPAEKGVPLSRWSNAEIAQEAVSRGIVAEISGTTVWRWLSEDAIRPWNYRSWIVRRDPQFAVKAGPILDLYLAAWDVRRAKIFDRCAPKDGIVSFDALIEQFMTVEPYRSAPRVFVIVDNGSAHRGKRSIDRLQGTWKNLVLVHTPVHASWLNQAEIYFSVVQRKALQPNDFADLQAVEQRLLAFGRRYEQIARPFQWKFTRQDLQRVLDRAGDTTEQRIELRAAA
jgi:hypothetical protein